MVYSGYYLFGIRSSRVDDINGQMGYFNDKSVVEVERRYSDFDLFRQTLSFEYPGFFIPLLPPKEALVAFSQEDSDSILQRKLGIQ